MEHLPQIIAEAAKSTLGIFALMLCILGWTGIVYFRKSADRIRVSMFLLMFAGVAGFGFALMRSAPAAPQSAAPQSKERPAAPTRTQEAVRELPDPPSTAPHSRDGKPKPVSPTGSTPPGSGDVQLTSGANSPIFNHVSGSVTYNATAGEKASPKDSKAPAGAPDTAP